MYRIIARSGAMAERVRQLKALVRAEKGTLAQRVLIFSEKTTGRRRDEVLCS
jgi:hypothetical protein